MLSAAWHRTTIPRPTGNGTASPVTTEIAYAPKNALMASHAIVLSQLMTAGTTIDLPNGSLDAGIWAMPVLGPIAAMIPTSPAPMTLPMTMAARPAHQPRPMKSAAARVPTKNAAGTRLGVNQTVNTRLREPYLALSGIGSIPWTSTVRSPSAWGILASCVVAVMLVLPLASRRSLDARNRHGGRPSSQAASRRRAGRPGPPSEQRA